MGGLVLVLGMGAVISALAGRGRWGALFGPGILVLACIWGISWALGADSQWIIPVALPVGTGALRIDALSRVFLVPLFLLSALVAVYGVGYLHGEEGQRHLGLHWAYVLGLVLGMTLVFTADDGFVFLVGWELMSVIPFFLVSWYDAEARVREAAWEYLIAAHLGAAALIAGMALAAVPAGWSFGAMRAALPVSQVQAASFLLICVGCAAKSGSIPMHVWLPEAHPAAPSHISALMSGLMVNTGIYGILRFLDIAGMPTYFGPYILIVGIATAIYAAMQILFQGNCKRLLAYSTVENMGIILIAIGTAMTSRGHGNMLSAFLGIVGALLHMFNHSIFKGLLFLGIGAVGHAADSVALNDLGGLARKMPWTSRCLVVAGATVAGIPPFCGFVGEMLIFASLATGMQLPNAGLRVLMAFGFVGLTVVSGFVLAGVVRLLGIGLLGAPRGPRAAAAHEVSPWMYGPMVVLAGLCVLLAVFAPQILDWALLAAVPVLRVAPPQGVDGFRAALAWVAALSVVIVCLGLVVFAARRMLPGWNGRSFRTWDCGYAAPSARMQYPAFGFAHPLWRALGQGTGYQVRIAGNAVSDLFPRHIQAQVVGGDALRSLWVALLGWIRSLCDALKWIQHGRIQLYLSTMIVVLLALLIWHLGW